MKRAPKRLHEADAGPLGDMLRAARSDELDEARVGRIQAGVAAALAVGGAGAAGAAGGAGAGASTAGAGAAAAGSGAAKWGGAFAAKVLAASVTVKVAAAGAVLCAVGAGVALADHYAPPDVARPSAPTIAVTASASPSPLPRSAPAAAPAPVAAPALSSVPRAVVPEPDALPAARSPRTASSAFPAEGALLLQARAALETDPARSLELVRRHEALFPKSQLVPERERIAAEASARLAH